MTLKHFCSAAVVASVWAAAVLAQDTQDGAAGVERGKQVYDHWCAPCHGSGLGLPGFGGLPGTQQLGIKYRDSDTPAVLDERTDLVPEFIEVIVRQGVSFMPQFRKTEIGDEDLDALSAYLTRNNPD
jgi:mono/diheme cytochrome c family protein